MTAVEFLPSWCGFRFKIVLKIPRMSFVCGRPAVQAALLRNPFINI